MLYSKGWYFPSALEDDLPSPHNPSDYPHFAAGENGNQLYDGIQAGEEFPDVWGMLDSLPPDCLEAFGDELWACSSAHFAYKYIKSSVYIVHTQYDSNQIYSRNQAPHDPVDDEELDMVKRYFQLWGNSTRQSLQVVVNDDVLIPKPHPDGVFSASCQTHGTPINVLIDGFSHDDLIRDWFFQYQELEDHYKLIEECTPLEGEEDYVIPCNTNPVCAYKPKPSKNTIMTCAQALFQGDCLGSSVSRSTCLRCARDIEDELAEAGCTLNTVSGVCNYVGANGMPRNKNRDNRAVRLIGDAGGGDFDDEDVDGGDFDDEMQEIDFTQLIEQAEKAPSILNHASPLMVGCTVLLGCIITFFVSL